jgi:hypothetical protein
MKVFFFSSPRGNLELSRMAYAAIERLGHKHTSDFVRAIDSKTFYAVSEMTWSQRYRERIKQLQGAEICVFEASIPSIATGQLFQEAIRQEKPTIALFQKDNRPYTLLGLEDNERRTQVLEYSRETLTEVLKDALDEAEAQLNTRFTMLMPAELTKFLDQINAKSGLSRSEFIRQLIREKMGSE